jgi:hypothetical protein
LNNKEKIMTLNRSRFSRLFSFSPFIQISLEVNRKLLYRKVKKKNSMAQRPEGPKPARRLLMWVRRGQRLASHSRVIWLS